MSTLPDAITPAALAWRPLLTLTPQQQAERRAQQFLADLDAKRAVQRYSAEPVQLTHWSAL